MDFKRGEQVEFEVSSLAYGGRGVARRRGYVVFVAGGLPGDRVVAEITRRKKSYAEARVLRLVEAGPDRVAVRCMHGGEQCPGAPWQTLDYAKQLEVKADQVRDALERIGGLSGFEVEPIVAADETWRYRNKLEYSFGGSEEGGLALGFHQRGDWSRVVDVDDCLLASDQSNEVRNFVRSWCSDLRLDPYDRRSGEGFLRNLVVREGRRTGQVHVGLVTGEPIAAFDPDGFGGEVCKEFDQVTSIVWTVNSGTAEVARGGVNDLLSGVEWIEESLGDMTFRIPYEAFFQTNTEMAEHLFAAAEEFAGLRGGERLFDLYCGIGTVGLLLSHGAGEVFGIDVVEESVRFCAENARLNGIENAQFASGDVRTALRPLVEQAGEADVAIVDPPRAGLSKKVVRRLMETGAGRVVYISCNPTTLAPNVRQMVDAGFELKKVRPVDMFPHTPHIECVALLER